jgi:hypothetical protein
MSSPGVVNSTCIVKLLLAPAEVSAGAELRFVKPMPKADGARARVPIAAAAAARAVRRARRGRWDGLGVSGTGFLPFEFR